MLFTSWDTEALMCKEVFTSPCLPQVLLNVTRLRDEIQTLISFCIQPISHPLLIESCQKITGQSFCSTGEAALVYLPHSFQPVVMNVKPLHFPLKDLTKPSHGLLVIPLLFTSLSPDLLSRLRNSQIFVPGEISAAHLICKFWMFIIQTVLIRYSK